MTGGELLALVAAGFAVRFWWKTRRIAWHTRQRDRHDSAAWRLMRAWW